MCLHALASVRVPLLRYICTWGCFAVGPADAIESHCLRLCLHPAHSWNCQSLLQACPRPTNSEPRCEHVAHAGYVSEDSWSPQHAPCLHWLLEQHRLTRPVGPLHSRAQCYHALACRILCGCCIPTFVVSLCSFFCPGNSSSCYYYLGTSAAYQAQRNSCIAMGGYLVAYNTPEEQVGRRSAAASAWSPGPLFHGPAAAGGWICCRYCL